MKNFVIRLFVNALALSAAAWLIDGIQLSGDFADVLWVALLFGLLNALLKPLLLFFSLLLPPLDDFYSCKSGQDSSSR